MCDHNGCHLCRYKLAKPWESPHLGYYCFCEESPHFGSVISKTGNDGPGCGCYMQSTYNDMTFLEALKILTFTPSTQEQMNEAHPYPVFGHRENAEQTPHITIMFKDNAQLEDWRDALTRLFTETMKYMRANGEFEDEKDTKKASSSPNGFPNFVDLYDQYMYREIGRHEFARELGVKVETLERLLKDYTNTR